MKRKDEQFLEEEGDYENNKDLIRVEWDKSKPKLSTLKELIDATYMHRREWICHCPLATEVLQTYPCMTNGKIVSSYNNVIIMVCQTLASCAQQKGCNFHQIHMYHIARNFEGR